VALYSKEMRIEDRARERDMKESAFDEIAEKYDEQIPRHIREHLCVKKVKFMAEEIRKRSGGEKGPAIKGLDCGCGTGWHAKTFRDNGFDVWGMDVSEGMIRQARENTGDFRFVTASSVSIPFKDESFDFVYLINILHHLATDGEQQKTLDEARRILRIGGKLFIQEVNESSRPFRFYMKYIFPLTNKIRGGLRRERRVTVKSILGSMNDAWSLGGVKYFTILPNITPAVIFPS
jgi:ubiquinone/menaquinone biosynthesis C-methylase UbiE